MAPIATYVFFDLEATGLPPEENNKTKITELSMIAVKRAHVLETRPGAVPRVQHKITLLFNPGRLISTQGSKITGLDNFLLEHEPKFNREVFDLLNSFLNILEKPVCLIAQNGLHFDYPLLKNHLEKLNVSFSDDLLCADCYHGFYDILEARKIANVPVEQAPTSKADISKNITQAEASKQQGNNAEVNADEKSTLKSTTLTSSEEDLFSLSNTLSMKVINETTPKQHKTNINNCKDDRNRVSKARRRMPFSISNKPTERYKLKDIYERVMNRPAIDAHRAENDCILALEVSVALGNDFVQWVDENYVPFSVINPMKVGVRIGD